MLATEISVTAQIATVEERSELSTLVRTSLIRTANGVLGGSEAAGLQSIDSEDSSSALDAFKGTIESLFPGIPGEKLRRVAHLLETLSSSQPDAAALESLISTPLAEAELSIVLPFLLRQADSLVDSPVWRGIGSGLSLKTIESLAPSLTGFNLNPLIGPIVGSLRGARSALFVNPDEITDEEKDEREVNWLMRGGRLSANLHRWSFWVATDSRKIKGRDDGPDARWDELSELLTKFDVLQVDLHGLSRRLSVANADPSSVREDVASIRSSIDDDFHVTSLRVREPGSSDEAYKGVTVEFGSATTTGDGTISLHLDAARLLSVRRPLEDEWVGVLKNSGHDV